MVGQNTTRAVGSITGQAKPPIPTRIAHSEPSDAMEMARHCASDSATDRSSFAARGQAHCGPRHTRQLGLYAAHGSVRLDRTGHHPMSTGVSTRSTPDRLARALMCDASEWVSESRRRTTAPQDRETPSCRRSNIAAQSRTHLRRPPPRFVHGKMIGQSAIQNFSLLFLHERRSPSLLDPRPDRSHRDRCVGCRRRRTAFPMPRYVPQPPARTPTPRTRT